MIDLSRINEEIRVRQILLKKDPELMLLIDKHTRRRGENYLALLINNGTIRLSPDGSLRINALRPLPQPSKLSKPLSPSTAKRPTAAPSDYPKLREANRQRTWSISTESFRIYRDLLGYLEINNRGQAALAACKLAAIALNIPVPQVRAWHGNEVPAANKLGWVCSNNIGEINITLSQPCKQIVFTAVHETKHVEQFIRFPSLSDEQRESDAVQFERDFAVYVLHEAPAAWLPRLH